MAKKANEYQVIIIGGGPAGLTAGIYTSRDKLKSLLIEKGLVGGQIGTAELVENYPGFPDGVGGFALTDLMQRQAAKFGLNTVTAEVTGIKPQKNQLVVKTTEGDYTAQAVIIASGSERRRLNVPGEKEFSGKGVAYCATCDAPLFRGKNLAIVGGGDSAITEALHLAKFASRVTLIHRRNQLRATAGLQEKAFSEPKLTFIWDTVIEGIEGDNFVRSLKLRQVKTGEKSSLEVSGIFVSVGFQPSTDYLKGILKLDEGGHIITNEKMETDVPGIFAAGDVRSNSARQAITAAGDGATAALYVEKFLNK